MTATGSPAARERDAPAGRARADAAAALRERLRAAVPDPLVPDRIAAVPELVHTRTGKVDRAGTRDRYL